MEGQPVMQQPEQVVNSVVTDSGETKPAGGVFSELFVCRLHEGAIHAIHIRRTRTNADVRANTLMNPSDAARALKDLGKNCRIILLLPKPLYLLRTVQLPKVASEDLQRMLVLEAQASLPPEFGAIEVGYRRLRSGGEGQQQHHELYIAREIEMKECLDRVLAIGIQPHYVLPSALAWDGAFRICREAQLIVIQSAAEQFETASRADTGAINVRVIETNGQGAHSARGLMDSVRPLLHKWRATSADPLPVAWVSDTSPPAVNDQIVLQDVSDRFPARPSGADAGPAMLRLAAAGLLQFVDEEVLRTANLMPRHLLVQGQARLLRRSLIFIAAALIGGLILLLGALQVGVHRYRMHRGELSRQIASIKAEGDAVGTRVDQLEAIRAVGVTRHDFSNIVSDLYDATPPGVTYSQIDCDERGQIRLRGQADSLSLPFLLPELLEKQPSFREVVLRDAGQSRRGEGSITEFRIDCKLQRDSIP